MSLLAFCCNSPTYSVFKASIHGCMIRFSLQFKKIWSQLWRQTCGGPAKKYEGKHKKIPSLHTEDNGLSGSFSISSYYLSVCISQLSWSDSSTHQSDAVNHETTRAEAQTTAPRMSETSWSHSHNTQTRSVTLCTGYERGGGSSKGLNRTAERHRTLLWRHKCPPVGKTKKINGFLTWFSLFAWLKVKVSETPQKLLLHRWKGETF